MKRNVKARPIPPKVIYVSAIFILVFAYVLVKAGVFSDKKIDNFESCVAAGQPILESYPERCVYKGKSYVNPTQQVKYPYQ